MMRRLLNLLTLLSLLLFVAVTVLWVRSYWLSDQLVVNTPHRSYQFSFSTGGVSIYAGWVKRRVHDKWEARWLGPFPS